MSDSRYLVSPSVNVFEKVARIARAGSVALGLLSETPEASIMGVSSRGVFIRLASRWVIFLSLERYCGPLTLNLQGFDDELQNIAVGLPVTVHDRSIHLPTTRHRFLFDRAVIWVAQPLPSEVVPVTQRLNRLAEVSRELSSMQKEGLFSGYLAAQPDTKQQTVSGLSSLDETLSAMQIALRERNAAAFTKSCGAVLGLGAGLTPSGDDLIAGLALALSRWGEMLLPELEREELFTELIPLAYSRTSLLSANLIECACRGEADERLILALDGIMAGVSSIPESAAALGSWGSSSGADALAGMALVLRANLSRSP